MLQRMTPRQPLGTTARSVCMPPMLAGAAVYEGDRDGLALTAVAFARALADTRCDEAAILLDRSSDEAPALLDTPEPEADSFAKALWRLERAIRVDVHTRLAPGAGDSDHFHPQAPPAPGSARGGSARFTAPPRRAAGGRQLIASCRSLDADRRRADVPSPMIIRGHEAGAANRARPFCCSDVTSAQATCALPLRLCSSGLDDAAAKPAWNDHRK